MLSACLNNQTSSKLILTASRHPQAHTDGSLSGQQSPLVPQQSGLRHGHLHIPSPTRLSFQMKIGDKVTGITARAALIVCWSWRLGGQVEQSHKTNPIIQEGFVPRSNSPSLSFCLLWNNFSAPLQKAQTFVFAGCLCSKSFLALFCTCCCSYM